MMATCNLIGIHTIRILNYLIWYLKYSHKIIVHAQIYSWVSSCSIIVPTRMPVSVQRLLMDSLTIKNTLKLIIRSQRIDNFTDEGQSISSSLVNRPAIHSMQILTQLSYQPIHSHWQNSVSHYSPLVPYFIGGIHLIFFMPTW